ncbi:MAG: helix-turn-helix domain-containing protein [Nitrospinales bacterium]
MATPLSQNLKTLRKQLNHTQLDLALLLNIGFRSYVRYENGERDAPASVLVSIAKLAGISLDRLLTTRIQEGDLKQPDAETPPSRAGKFEIIGGSLEEGRLVFKGLKGDYLITTGEKEKKLIGGYRQMGRQAQKDCVLYMEWFLRNYSTKKKKAPGVPESKKEFKARNAARLKKRIQSVKKVTLKG